MATLAKSDLLARLKEPHLTNLFPTDADVDAVATNARRNLWGPLGVKYAQGSTPSDGEKGFLILATIIERFLDPQLYAENQQYVDALIAELKRLTDLFLAGKSVIAGLTLLTAEQTTALGLGLSISSNERRFTADTYVGF